MRVTVWHYPNCSTCKNAVRWLKDQGVAFDAVDLVASPPDAPTLAEVQRLAGVDVRKLLNTSGQVFREEGWAERARGMPDAELHAALSTRGKLIKRPLLRVERADGSAACVGFREDQWRQALHLSA